MCCFSGFLMVFEVGGGALGENILIMSYMWWGEDLIFKTREKSPLGRIDSDYIFIKYILQVSLRPFNLQPPRSEVIMMSYGLQTSSHSTCSKSRSLVAIFVIP